MQINTDFIYPIGSIYMSVDSTNPSKWFGGTWVSWGTGRVPVGVDTSQTEFATVEQTGGNKNMQKHHHTGTTGGGRTNFLRMVWGTMVDRATGNHIGSSGNGGQRDLQNTGDFPGANHTHSFTTNDAGTGDSGNLQPYITCYMWKRTA